MGYLGVALCVLICSLLIKDKHRVFSFALILSGICIIAVYSVSGLKSIVASASSIAEAAVSSELLTLMLKALAITLITGTLSDICRDNGESALAGITETASKIVIIVMLLPLFENVIEIVNGLVK